MPCDLLCGQCVVCRKASSSNERNRYNSNRAATTRRTRAKHSLLRDEHSRLVHSAFAVYEALQSNRKAERDTATPRLRQQWPL